MDPDKTKGRSGNLADVVIESERPREDGDDTKRVKRVVHDEIAPSIATVKRIQFWATVAMLVAGVGFSTAMFLNRYATAADLDKLADRQAATQSTLEQHMVNESAKLGALESQGHNIESDYHSVREQLWKIADRVGAARIAIPAHVDPAMPPAPGR